MAQGRTVAARLREDGGRGGIPWMAILDADGGKLVTSDGPKGNVGYPVEPHEIEYFMTMVKQTAKHMGPPELSEIEQALQKAAEKYLGPRS